VALFIARRLLLLVPILLGVSIVIFLMLRLIPGDPARLEAGPDATLQGVEATRHELGLDRSWPEQYVIFIQRLAHGDLGRSSRTHEPVAREIGSRFPATVELTLAAIAIALFLGVSAGVLAATQPNSPVDYTSMVAALLGISAPSFWLGLMLISLFSVSLGWFPSGGADEPLSLVMPAVTLGLGSTAFIARVTRASTLEILNHDYIRTARAKGMAERRVVYLHALRNALIPIVTVAGLQFGFLLGGAVVVETVFAWPGVGRLLVDAIAVRDYPVVQGVMLLLATEFVLVNLLVDVLYALIDPRIRYSARA